MSKLHAIRSLFAICDNFRQAIRMELLNSYRSAFDYKEILRILQKSTVEQENFVWQSSSKGKNVIDILQYEIDFVAREVVVYFDPNRSQVDSSLPLFVKLEYRTSIFKITDFRLGMNSLHFAFPKEIKTVELRQSPRIVFEDERSIALKPSLPTGRDLGSEIDVRVFDVSKSGVGLLVSESNRQFFKNNRLLWITRIGKRSLTRPILGEVVYIKNDGEAGVRKSKSIRVGIKLSSLIPTDIYTEFTL